ncbi:C4-dicarboxylate transporter/malic acid transport protein-like protein [Hypomontagnella monticulosa]|nr:C4-dicarboxylate transporter/malic acid transport protein-like protein [Hypomontagnella monticulosa]
MSKLEVHRRSHGYESIHVSVKERLSHFTWAWFDCTMATGAIAVLLGQQPYTFPGLTAIGKIFFILDLVLFSLFCVLITCRFVMHPRALRLSLHHPHESFFFGAFWVSISSILYSAQLYGVPSCGPWLVTALRVLFWMYATCALLIVIFQYHVIFDEEELPVADAMPAWILPAYPFLVLGPLAAILEYSQPQQYGIPILIGGLIFEGLGWSVAFIMYTVYFTRLASNGLPEPSKRPGMFVAVGPAGYTATTLAALGSQAPRIIPHDYLGITSEVPVGDLWKGFSVPAAMFVWLLGFWFFALALWSCLRGARQMHFTLSWWAFVFPNAGLTLGVIKIANAIDSEKMKGVVSGMTLLLVIVWVGVAIMNVRAVWMRQILWPGRDEDLEELEEHRAS